MGYPDQDAVQCPCREREAGPEHYLTQCPIYAVFIQGQLGTETPSTFQAFFHNINNKILKLFCHLYRMIGTQHKEQAKASNFDTLPPSEESHISIGFSDHG